jgi:hypothetical protein
MTDSTGAAACPLCGHPPRQIRKDPSGRDALAVECERCGRFSISETLMVTGLEAAQKPLLSAYCRRLPEGSDPPRITTTTADEFMRTLPSYTPPEKMDNLLELLGRRSAAPGEFAPFTPGVDYPLLIARDPKEVQFLLSELTNRGFIGTSNAGIWLKLAGWERLEEIRKKGRLSNRAFVAMWFDKTMDDVYANAIKPAIRDAGYDPLRIDRHEHVNRIDDEIIAQIRRSRFMVADFTGQRYGVYFEAGMMMGLGRAVIWLCDKRELDEAKLHFDVRQFNFIDYESTEEAKKRLYIRILAIEGEGPGQFQKPA